MNSSPKLLVIAGPNGSGKSTIKNGITHVGMWINADEIKQRSGCTDMEAAQEAEKLREYHLSNLKDFSFETVLSTCRNISLMKRAKEAGYHVECCFVLTTTPSLNVFRVHARCLSGGHSVPQDKVVNRYYKSIKNIRAIIPICDTIRIIDNTDKPFIIFTKDRDEQPIVSENRYWDKRRILNLINNE